MEANKPWQKMNEISTTDIKSVDLHQFYSVNIRKIYSKIFIWWSYGGVTGQNEADLDDSLMVELWWSNCQILAEGGGL